MQKDFHISSILDKLKNLQAAGKRLVIGHGAFNRIHAGNLQYLRDIEKYGDVLVIALYSNNSLKVKHGQEYKCEPEELRLKRIIDLGARYAFILECKLEEILILLSPCVIVVNLSDELSFRKQQLYKYNRLQDEYNRFKFVYYERTPAQN